MTAVGKNIPHDSATGHVTGKSEFIDDIPLAKNELYASFFTSPVARGKILSVNIEDALSVEGVIGIYLHKDIPGNRKVFL